MVGIDYLILHIYVDIFVSTQTNMWIAHMQMILFCSVYGVATLLCCVQQ